ncbi:hypothetical protein SCLCIDRAFT_140379 [Scleroderma citrinum Foug A]|uniref:Myb/SANT-like domain-containing protein n=1 Tax=Scleroderma citrinum Foug A TaxID=1036808 RepID=A0A0C3D8P0_9AGAM|nr:hypothetical protein SCLCIDRAFT_140379 [Scleroderma citrinum Foug A]
MLQDQAGDVGKAQWNNIEIAKLVDYLYEHCAQGGDTGNFRDTVYNSAAEYIWPFHTMGPIKTGKMVKNKWTLIKGIYNMIETWHSQSGYHWNNEYSANV